MAWNNNLVDVIARIFSNPGKYLGLTKLVSQESSKGAASTQKPVYMKAKTLAEVLHWLNGSEEILNEHFNLTFAVAPDQVISKLLFSRAGFADGRGPIRSLSNREIAEHHNWGQANITQPDGLFVSDNSLLCVELKLKANSSPKQIANYLALIMLEAQDRKELGLLFITPPVDQISFLSKCNLKEAKIGDEFLDSINSLDLNPYIRKIIDQDKNRFRSVAKSMKIRCITWADIYSDLNKMLGELNQKDMGQQTLYRLLEGFRDQLKAQRDTGIDFSKP